MGYCRNLLVSRGLGFLRSPPAAAPDFGRRFVSIDKEAHPARPRSFRDPSIQTRSQGKNQTPASRVAKGAVPDEEGFAQQLGSPGYHVNRSNQLVIEAKQEMQKRGLASPDDADALALTFARAVAPVAPKRPARRYVPISPWS